MGGKESTQIKVSSNRGGVQTEKTCGFFVMKPDWSFLLLERRGQYHLPKGHVEAGETEPQTAFRGKQYDRTSNHRSYENKIFLKPI